MTRGEVSEALQSSLCSSLLLSTLPCKMVVASTPPPQTLNLVSERSKTSWLCVGLPSLHSSLEILSRQEAAIRGPTSFVSRLAGIIICTACCPMYENHSFVYFVWFSARRQKCKSSPYYTFIAKDSSLISYLRVLRITFLNLLLFYNYVKCKAPKLKQVICRKV